jgi:hypothetical protein
MSSVAAAVTSLLCPGVAAADEAAGGADEGELDADGAVPPEQALTASPRTPTRAMRRPATGLRVLCMA